MKPQVRDREEFFLQTLDAEVIAPCPFCGKRSAALLRHEDTRPLFSVICHVPVGCSGTGPLQPTRAAAIAAWDRRAP